MSRIIFVAGGVLACCAAATALVLSRGVDVHGTQLSGGEERAVLAGAAGTLLDPRPDWPEPPRAGDGDGGEDEDATVGGYSGTSAVRRHVRPPAHRPRLMRPDWRDDWFVPDSGVDALAAQLPRQKTYADLLGVLHRLAGPLEAGPVPAGADPSEAPPVTRFFTEPERMARLLDEALAAATNGVVRQALIFHMAVGLPPEHAVPRLRQLWFDGDAADSEDALCALAFSGDAEALARFESLPPDPGAVVRDPLVWSLEDAERLYAEERRDVLRSYRCIETLDLAPYFHEERWWIGCYGRRFPWGRAQRRDASLAERTLRAWLVRYPGHAGTDDMAYRIARMRLRDGDRVDALRWASYGATEPDGDMRPSCLALLTALVELAPSGSRECEDVIDPARPERNRDLLLYMRVRRHAQDLGYRAALRELEDIARCEPGLVLARGWRERWTAPVPKGLDSGLHPLPSDDPLRRVDRSREGPDPEPSRVPCERYPPPVPFPAPDVGVLRLDVLRRQVRAWETLAALEERGRTARGDDAVDLLYKRGALHYHERDVLFPAYAYHTTNDSGCPGAGVLGSASSIDRWDVDGRWLRGVLSWERAITELEELVSLHPGHPLAADALYSIGLAHVKAADDRALQVWEWRRERNRHIRAAVDAFERLIARFPRSSLRPPAEAAMRYWRAERASLFVDVGSSIDDLPWAK